MNTVELLKSINQIIEKLHQKTTVEEENDGWSDEIKVRVESYFKDVKILVVRNIEVEHVGIIRSLDFDGVCHGELIYEIAQLMKSIRKYNSEL